MLVSALGDDKVKTIIAGPRTAEYHQVLYAIGNCPWVNDISLVISGNAKGADRHGEKWAAESDIPIQLHIPQWSKYGRAAGPRRNAEMAKIADSLIAVWDGKSRGTKHMIATALKLNMPAIVYRTDMNKLIISNWDKSYKWA